MSGLQRILVVDSGARTGGHPLSAELAELGYASVTTSLEAAEDVLQILPSPAAIVLQLPRRAGQPDRDAFLQLASRLKNGAHTADIPLIWADSAAAAPGGFASALRSRIAPRVVNEPGL